jgi:hypothetical protein
MAWQQVLEAFELLDSARVDGAHVAEWLRQRGVDDVSTTRIEGERGSTDFVKVIVPGNRGQTAGGAEPAEAPDRSGSASCRTETVR